MAKEKKQRHWLSRLSFGTVSLAFSGLLLLSYLSLLIDPAKAWFFTLFGLLYIPVLLVVAVLFILSLFRRSHMRGLLLLMLLPSIFIFGKYYQFRGPSEDKPATLSILSYNVGLFTHGDGEKDPLELADEVCDWLKQADADIICLQEFCLPGHVDFGSWLRRRFPGYEVDYFAVSGPIGQFGNVTLSRRPITGKGKNNFEKSTNMALWTDVLLDSSTVRLYNCHFESYNISLSGLVKKAGEEGLVEETGQKMRRSITERPKQVAQVMRDVDAAPVRSLVLGDFNDNPLSYTCFRLLRGRKDSFVTAGKGFGATYRSLWPLLRIDYILYPKDLTAVSYKVEKVKYSDHYPIIATYYESGRNTR